LHGADPEAASRIQAVMSMPGAGSDFLGFHLKEEVGRGAFARVFLAQQGALANRPVALKISAKLHEESQRLAQLQHTNIVPIYSLAPARVCPGVRQGYREHAAGPQEFDHAEACFIGRAGERQQAR
jgi:hypothetical protein